MQPSLGRKKADTMRRLMLLAMLLPLTGGFLWSVSCEGDNYRNELPLRPFDTEKQDAGYPDLPFTHATDMAKPADQAAPGDLLKPADLATQPDLATLPDLTALPDLTPPADL